MCVCVCVCERERDGEMEGGEYSILPKTMQIVEEIIEYDTKFQRALCNTSLKNK